MIPSADFAGLILPGVNFTVRDVVLVITSITCQKIPREEFNRRLRRLTEHGSFPRGWDRALSTSIDLIDNDMHLAAKKRLILECLKHAPVKILPIREVDTILDLKYLEYDILSKHNMRHPSR